MDSLAKQFEQYKDEKPDEWTIAWWRAEFAKVVQGYRGATHAINLANAGLVDAREQVEALRAECEALKRQAEADRAKIGELSARVDKIAAFANELRLEREAAKKGKAP